MPDIMRPRQRILPIFASLAILLAVVGLANGVIALLLPRQIDLTRKRVFTLSPLTQNLLRGMTQSIEVTLLAPREPKTAGERAFAQGALMLRELLENYKAHQPSLAIREFDPLTSDEGRRLLEKHPDLSPPCALVRMDGIEGHEVLHARDLAEIQPAGAGRPPTVEFYGEAALTAALIRLSSGRKPTIVYVLTGHGELALEDVGVESRRGLGVLAEQWSKLNIEMRPLDLRVEPRVPADASLVVLAGGDQSLSAAECDALRLYWKHRGRGLVLCDSRPDRQEGRIVETGVDQLLAEFGVRLGHDRVVMRGVTGRIDAASLAQPAAGDHPLVRSLSSASLVLLDCRSVRPLIDVSRSSLCAIPLLVSHAAPHAWAEGDLSSDGEPEPDGPNDLPGPVAMAVAVERHQGDLYEPVLVVVGDAEFLDNRALGEPAGRRASSFALGCVNWLRGRMELLGDIPPSRNEGYRLSGTSEELRGLVWKPTLLFSALLLSAGATVWGSRRQG